MRGPIMHVDMDAFFAAIEQRDDPRLVGKPVIVGAEPGKRGVVSTCSYEARRFGVHSAMPINEAYRLCPEGVFLTPDFTRYHAASQALAEIFASISPIVEMASVDEAYLNLGGLERLFGTPEDIGRLVKRRITERLRLSASVGIGPNRLVAKMASDFDKPDGLTIVPPERVLDFLAPMPIGKLRGVGKAGEETLIRLGIRTIGDLRAKDLAWLRDRVGNAAAVSLFKRSRGEGSDVVGEREERKSISEETTFEQDTSDEATLMQVLLREAAGVGRQARSEGVVGTTLTLKLRLEGFETHTKRRKLPAPTQSDREIFAHAKELYLESGYQGRVVRLIGCGLSGLQAADGAQLALFEPASAKLDRLYAALDNVQARFGRQSLHVANQAPSRRLPPRQETPEE